MALSSLLMEVKAGSCYTDTLPSAVYWANFVLALLSCLKHCLYESSFLSYLQ